MNSQSVWLLFGSCPVGQSLHWLAAESKYRVGGQVHSVLAELEFAPSGQNSHLPSTPIWLLCGHVSHMPVAWFDSVPGGHTLQAVSVSFGTDPTLHGTHVLATCNIYAFARRQLHAVLSALAVAPNTQFVQLPFMPICLGPQSSQVPVTRFGLLPSTHVSQAVFSAFGACPGAVHALHVLSAESR